MTDETLTAPCEGIGVWEGARVVYAPARGYQGSLRRPGDAGIVVATEQRGSAVWALAAFGADIEPHPLTCLRLDLTHRQTRNEAALRADALLVAATPALLATALHLLERTLQILSDLGAQTGSIDERARWCRDHLVHVNAVGVMARSAAAASSASDTAHANTSGAI